MGNDKAAAALLFTAAVAGGLLLSACSSNTSPMSAAHAKTSTSLKSPKTTPDLKKGKVTSATNTKAATPTTVAPPATTTPTTPRSVAPPTTQPYVAPPTTAPYVPPVTQPPAALSVSSDSIASCNMTAAGQGTIGVGVTMSNGISFTLSYWLAGQGLGVASQTQFDGVTYNLPTTIYWRHDSANLANGACSTSQLLPTW